MRTPVWESAPGALAAMFATGGLMTPVGLYTITMPDGEVIRWSGGDQVVAFGGHTWVLGPGIVRSDLTFSTGVSVDTCTLTLLADEALGIERGGLPLLAWILEGGLDDGAHVDVLTAYFGPDHQAGDIEPVGVLHMFAGTVGPAEGSARLEVTLPVESYLAKLNVMVPRDVYQAGCLNTLFGQRCGLVRSDWSVAVVASGGTDPNRLSFTGSMPVRPDNPAGDGDPLRPATERSWWASGALQCISGANAGVRRTVRGTSQGVWTVAAPWPHPVVTGDQFVAVPGCDKRRVTCLEKFNNLKRFRGMPYVPAAETVT